MNSTICRSMFWQFTPVGRSCMIIFDRFLKNKLPESMLEQKQDSWNSHITRVKIFLRFTAIFLRSANITVNLLKPPMRRYRRNSDGNWGWPPQFFNEKPLFPPISHKKASVKFFDTDGEKGVPNRKARFPQNKNKIRCNVFCFKMEAIVHRNLCPEVSEKIGKIKFHTL